MSDDVEVKEATSPDREVPQLQEAQPREAAATTPTPSPQDRATAILSELAKLGVEKPQDVLQTASAYGKVSNQLGDAYRRIQQLESQLAAMAKTPTPSRDFQSDGGSIDLAALISAEAEKASERATRRVIGEIVQTQARMAKEYGEVQSDEDYGLVKDTWEQVVKTPEFYATIQAGEISIPMAYQKLKEKVLKTKMREMADILKQFTTPSQATPPHIESGQTRSNPMPSESQEIQDRIQKIEAARRSGKMGSTKALEELFNTISPKTDPIWNVETAPRKKR